MFFYLPCGYRESEKTFFTSLTACFVFFVVCFVLFVKVVMGLKYGLKINLIQMYLVSNGFVNFATP